MKMPVFGQRLRVAIAARGFNKTCLAAHLGVSTPMVTYWTDGKQKPTDHRIGEICDVLRCPRDWLLDPAPFSFQGSASPAPNFGADHLTEAENSHLSAAPNNGGNRS